MPGHLDTRILASIFKLLKSMLTSLFPDIYRLMSAWHHFHFPKNRLIRQSTCLWMERPFMGTFHQQHRFSNQGCSSPGGAAGRLSSQEQEEEEPCRSIINPAQPAPGG
jgi:hypothetical protein